MSLSNSVTTELIDPRSHSNQRTEFRLDDAYYASSLKLIDVGLIATKNPGGADAAGNSASTVYPQINGVMQCIRNIYLYSGTTLLDSVQNCAQYSAIQALKTPNQGSIDLNRDLLLNGMGFSQSPIPEVGGLQRALARKPETLCTQDQSLKEASRLTNTATETPANFQCPIAGVEQGASGSVLLSQLLQMLQGMSVLPRLPNLRILIEWDTDLTHYFDGGVVKNTSLSVIRPTLVAEKILGMPEETPDLAVPYMSTIVERFNIPKAHGAAVVSGVLAADPFALVNGSPEVTVTISAAQATQLDLRQNEPVVIAGGAAIRQAASTAADATSISVTNASTNVVCTLAAHGFKVGDVITIANATDTGGIIAADLNGDQVITVVATDDTFTFVADAPGTATEAGGGATVTYQLAEAFAATDVNGAYIIKSVAANQQSFVIDFNKASNFTSTAGAGGAAITIATVLNKTSITRASHRSQAFTNKFVRELVLFNLTPDALAAGDRYVTQQTRSPAQVNEVLQMVVNNVNHIPDQGISSEALRCLYLNSAQPSLNIPFIAMLGDSGSQRLAVADDKKEMIYPYGALRNNFSITAAKLGVRVQDLRFEHQRTYGGRPGSHDAYTLICFGTVARVLTVKNGVLNVSY
jgi:hypothetical protein